MGVGAGKELLKGRREEQKINRLFPHLVLLFVGSLHILQHYKKKKKALVIVVFKEIPCPGTAFSFSLFSVFPAAPFLPCFLHPVFSMPLRPFSCPMPLPL